MPEDNHQHSYVRLITNTTGPFPAEGVDGNGKPTVVHFYVDYWEERCLCGDVRSSGSDTRSA
jgi:hypothetical protein